MQCGIYFLFGLSTLYSNIIIVIVSINLYSAYYVNATKIALHYKSAYRNVAVKDTV